MKRTKQIDLQQMRKQPLYSAAKLAAAIGLSACCYRI